MAVSNIPQGTVTQQYDTNPPYSSATAASIQESQRTSARRILRSAQRGIAPIGNVMGTPPTIAAGTAGAASTLNGNTIANPRYKYTANGGGGLLWDVTGSEDPTAGNGADKTVSYIDNNSRSAAHGNCKSFCTDAPAFDIAIGGGSSGVPFMVYVTDLTVGASSRARVAANDLTIGASGYYHLFTFADARPRKVEIYCGSSSSLLNVPVFGFNVAAAYSMWSAPEPDQPYIVFLSDSWFDNGGLANTNSTKLLLPDYIGEGLGINSPLSVSRAGTGWVNRATNKGTFGERIANGDLDVSRIGVPDAIIIPDSINDATFDSTLTANKVAALQLLRQKQPLPLIIGYGPQVTPGTATPQSRFDLGQAAFNAALGNDYGAFWLDNSPSGENWLSAANAAQYFTSGTDQNHLDDNGNPKLGRRIPRSIIKQLRARYI